MKNKICPECGSEFTPDSRVQKFCKHVCAKSET